MTKNYIKPTSSIDPTTGEVVIRVSPATISTLTERWYVENSLENEQIRITDAGGLAEAVSANVHSFGEDWFPAT